MNYLRHKILPSGHIELVEKTDASPHYSVIEPNQPVEKYKDQIEADPDYEKYRTQENADAYEAQLQADQPSEQEKLEQWRASAKVRTWQLKAILDEDSLLETVEGMVAQSSKAVQLAFEHAPDVQRKSNAVNQILEALQFTPEQGDEIFKRAKQIEI